MKKKIQNKHEQNLLLVFSDSDLQKRINKTREIINAPANKISNATLVDRETILKQWANAIIELDEEIFESEPFKKSLDIIKQRFNNNEIGRREAEKLSHELHLQIPTNYLIQFINDIIEEYNLPQIYSTSIRGYIISGILHINNVPSFGIRTNFHDDSQNNTIDIVVYSQLTDKDLREIKKIVNIFEKNKISKKINKIKNFDVKISTFRNVTNKKRYDEVEQKFFKLTPAEIIDEVKNDTGKKIKKNDLYEYTRQISEIKKRRFKKPGTK
ncbi:MAG TPA: hypothetical protein PKA60_02925 [Candidatus Paceibacterota bacterium]|nr:hypothetical protein [Candidatus Paceibacterota bacterium]